MVLKRKQKAFLVKDLIDKIKKEKAIILTNFEGCTASDLNVLRKSLKAKGMYYKAAKKTLIRRALNQAGIKDIDDAVFKGQLAMAFSPKDEVAAAREIYQFQKKKNKDMILFGILNKELVDKQKVLALALLPGIEVLRVKLAGIFKAPIYGLANVLSGNQRKLVYALRAIGEKKI